MKTQLTFKKRGKCKEKNKPRKQQTSQQSFGWLMANHSKNSTEKTELQTQSTLDVN